MWLHWNFSARIAEVPTALWSGCSCLSLISIEKNSRTRRTLTRMGDRMYEFYRVASMQDKHRGLVSAVPSCLVPDACPLELVAPYR